MDIQTLELKELGEDSLGFNSYRMRHGGTYDTYVSVDFLILMFLYD